MAGFPQRPARASFGVALHNERMPEDPREELGEAELALLLWQVAALGRGAPKAVVVYQPAGGPGTLPERVKLGLLAWDDNVYVDQAPAFGWITPTVNATGDYNMVFTTPVNNEAGTPTALVIAAAMAFPVGYAASPIVGNPAAEAFVAAANSVRVQVYQRPSGALAYQSFLLVVW